MRSVYDAVKIKTAVEVCELSTTTTPTAKQVAVDAFGYNSALFNLAIGTPYGTTNAVTYTIQAKVQECDTSGGTYADVSGATATVTVNGTTTSPIARNAQIRVEGLGTSRQRYLKVVISPAILPATDAKVPVSAIAVLGRAFSEPVGNSATAAA